MSAQLPQTLRADARDNRERILRVARDAFAADGLDVSMRELATRAGVGPATLYRHFPSKQDLAAATFADEARACRSIVDAGLEDADPWRGFCRIIERLCDLHVRNGGFTAAFLAAYPGMADVATGRAETLRALAELVDRAKATGRLRHDFVLNDLVLMLAAHRGVRGGAGTGDPQAASRRFARLAIQAFAGEEAGAAPREVKCGSARSSGGDVPPAGIQPEAAGPVSNTGAV